MSVSHRDQMRWQLDLTWSLLEHHLERLEPDDLLWEPAQACWTVRQDSHGVWMPDWEVPEPDPVPVPTIAWITWHLGWWWSVACDHAVGRPPRERTQIAWPGDGRRTIAWLRTIHGEWCGVLASLTDAELDRTAGFPWPADAGYTVAHMISWANAELMKNTAEIGQLRMLRAAR